MCIHVTLHTPDQSDPNLQPISLMETRNIIPQSPIVPPSVALPNNLARFTPDHKVFCCTMNTVPATNSLLNKLKLPFAIHIHPFKDMAHNVSCMSFLMCSLLLLLGCMCVKHCIQCLFAGFSLGWGELSFIVYTLHILFKHDQRMIIFWT